MGGFSSASSLGTGRENLSRRSVQRFRTADCASTRGVWRTAGERAARRETVETIALASLKEPEPEGPQETVSDETEDSDPPTNHGKLIADATCVPADIRYPTDVSLLNEAREKTEEIIDQLHSPLVSKEPHPRTYRKKTRRAFVAFTKHKKAGRKKIRRAKRAQLGFLRRNFKAIDRLLENPEALPLTQLSRRKYKNLLITRELFRQQLEMFENNSNRVDDRIVSISQPHIRPIVCGKAGKPTEFGAKLSISVVQGFSFVDRLSWDSYNAGADLIEQIKTYHRRFGYYPESAHVDNIYRSFCCVMLGAERFSPKVAGNWAHAGVGE